MLNPRAYADPPETMAAPARPSRRSGAAGVGQWSLVARLARVRLLPVTVAIAVVAVALRVADLLDPTLDLGPADLFDLPSARAQEDDASTEDADEPPASVLADPSLLEEAKDDALSFNATEVEILQRLAARREALDARERALDQREAIIAAAEQRVQEQTQRLEQLKADLEALMGQRSEADAERITAQVKRFEAMKPAEAALIFDGMDAQELAPVVEAMSERKAAPILAKMDTDRARVLIRHLMAPIGEPPGGGVGLRP